MVIALLTDFGDFYAGVMKGVMRKITKEEIIDIAHSVSPQNIYEGAFLLYNSYRFFPKNTIFVAVVDPGVGGEREALIIETRNYYFVSPNNGISYLSAKDDGIKRAFKIKREVSRFSGEISSTFHGRDIFAPAAALLSINNFDYFEEIEKSKIKKLELFDVKVSGDKIKCRVLHIDRFGNVVTNIREEIVKNKRIKAIYYKDMKIPLVEKYSDVNVCEPLALIGSFKTLELSLREDNFAKRFGIGYGVLNLGWS